MTTWHQRMLPYPLLAPWTEDYERSTFGVDVPKAVLNNGREIRVRLMFRLYSDTLRGLIGQGDAMYAVEVSCPGPSVRGTFQALEQYELVLEADDCDEEILLAPYIVATRALRGFTSPGHVAEWRSHRPDGFSVPELGSWP